MSISESVFFAVVKQCDRMEVDSFLGYRAEKYYKGDAYVVVRILAPTKNVHFRIEG